MINFWSRKAESVCLWRNMGMCIRQNRMGCWSRHKNDGWKLSFPLKLDYDPAVFIPLNSSNSSSTLVGVKYRSLVWNNTRKNILFNTVNCEGKPKNVIQLTLNVNPQHKATLISCSYIIMYKDSNNHILQENYKPHDYINQVFIQQRHLLVIENHHITLILCFNTGNALSKCYSINNSHQRGWWMHWRGKCPPTKPQHFQGIVH